jgi:hypothetical protein
MPIGYFCSIVPEELLPAAGAFPLRVMEVFVEMPQNKPSHFLRREKI